MADGATLTIARHADGYHIEVTATDGAGRTVRREVVHARLEQALFAVVAGEGVEGYREQAGFGAGVGGLE